VQTNELVDTDHASIGLPWQGRSAMGVVVRRFTLKVSATGDVISHSSNPRSVNSLYPFVKPRRQYFFICFHEERNE